MERNKREKGDIVSGEKEKRVIGFNRGIIGGIEKLAFEQRLQSDEGCSLTDI